MNSNYQYIFIKYSLLECIEVAAFSFLGGWGIADSLDVIREDMTRGGAPKATAKFISCGGTGEDEDGAGRFRPHLIDNDSGMKQ